VQAIPVRIDYHGQPMRQGFALSGLKPTFGYGLLPTGAPSLYLGGDPAQPAWFSNVVCNQIWCDAHHSMMGVAKKFL
jgi:hypothetical protein